MINWDGETCIDYLEGNLEFLVADEKQQFLRVAEKRPLTQEIEFFLQSLVIDVLLRKEARGEIKKNTKWYILQCGPVKHTSKDGTVTPIYSKTIDSTSLLSMQRKMRNLKLYLEVTKDVPEEDKKTIEYLMTHYSKCGCFSYNLRRVIAELHERLINE